MRSFKNASDDKILIKGRYSVLKEIERRILEFVAEL